ncbi:22137_t:CDS:2, partial [Gigaspora margarita]
MEEISMAESSIVESPILEESSTMVESPIIVESPTIVESPIIVESPVMVESPTIVESPIIESSMEEENQTKENLQREVCLECDQERKWQKRAKDKLYKIKEGLEEFEANFTDDSNRDFQSEIDIHMNEPDIPLPLPFTILEEYDKVLLREYRHCYTEKTLSKKFSFGNNMDPGEVPEELQGLTEIEEMLIVQVFPVMVVYRLCGGQHGYRGNIINFPQDVEEFTTRLPWYPSLLN